jgi:hypothetical protein
MSAQIKGDMVALMGGVCKEPPFPHKAIDKKTVVYLVLLVGFYAWLHANGELIPVLQLGAKLLCYCGLAWAGLHVLDLLLRALLRAR